MGVPETREKFSRDRYDAIVVGSGPNGLTAAILLLQRGLSVAVVEGQSTAGEWFCRSAAGHLLACRLQLMHDV